MKWEDFILSFDYAKHVYLYGLGLWKHKGALFHSRQHKTLLEYARKKDLKHDIPSRQRVMNDPIWKVQELML